MNMTHIECRNCHHVIMVHGGGKTKCHFPQCDCQGIDKPMDETIHLPCVVCDDLFPSSEALECDINCDVMLHHTEGWWYCSEMCREKTHEPAKVIH